MRKRRRSFTLLELLLVMGLVALVLGTLCLSIPKALRKERFEKEVDEVIAKISLAQEIMIDTGSHVLLHLEVQEERGVECILTPPGFLKQRLPKNPCRFKEIEKLSFNGQEQTISLHFDAAFGITPKGVLVIEGREGKRELFLPGFPAKIKKNGHEEVSIERTSYPQEILSLT